jgi:hypothetical protein
METSLHQQIKKSLARDAQSTEVVVGSYRIDAIDQQNRLVEVQFGPLGALRRKVMELREDQVLRIVKPIIVEKKIVTLHPRNKSVLRARKSPKRGSALDVFSELIHFTKCFPHPNVVLDCWLVHVTEHRVDVKTKRRRRKPYRLIDVFLDEKINSFKLQTAADLKRMLAVPRGNAPFCTQWLAQHLSVNRWFAQQIAYVLFHCGAAVREGKRGNSHLYRWDTNVSPVTSAPLNSMEIAA